jgi:hypothetical protein
MIETLISRLSLAIAGSFEKTVALFTLLRLVDPMAKA